MTPGETAVKNDLYLRWLRLKRHLRTAGPSPRARRDAARALAGRRDPLSSRECLCRPALRLAA
jgi:hypothetical protein